MSKVKEVPVDGKVAHAAEVVGSDEFSGRGGSYVFNPETGSREPTPETVEHHALKEAQ